MAEECDCCHNLKGVAGLQQFQGMNQWHTNEGMLFWKALFVIPPQHVLALSKAGFQKAVLLVIVSEATSNSTGFAHNDLSVEKGTKFFRNTFDSPCCS